MKHVIIGSAGHVDHGKTCLIKALTGIDTDRLKEEKKRGITIELGFAYLDLPNGQRAGIVDVPGHEKFVKNMLAGAGGMDLVMLMVAADEGVMPQTVEHLDILSVLGITSGVLVITKTDLVEDEFLELVKEDIRELVRGTFLENASVVPVSSYNGEGIDELKEVLQELCDKLPERKNHGTFRLPIDRVFTMKGYGTVVTGTLLDGQVKRDKEVMLYPQGIPVRVRNIQVHSCDEQTAYAHQRVALNIPNRKKEEIRKGDVLAVKGSLWPVMMLDVRLFVLKHTERTVKNASRVHVYLGTKEVLGKVILLDSDEKKAGETGYAQLRLEEEITAKRGDRFVIRFYSPVETVGGGIVLDACPGKHRRRDHKALHALEIREVGSQMERLELAVREQWGCFYSLTEIAMRNSLDGSVLKNNTEKLCRDNCLVRLRDDIYIHREELDHYRKETIKILNEFHKTFPLKEGMGKEELRSRIGIGKGAALTDCVLEALKERKVIREHNQLVSNYSFRVVIQEDDSAYIREITDFYRKAGFAPLATEIYMQEHKNSKKFRAVFTSLLNKKILIRLNDQYCIHKSHYQQAQEAFREMAEKKSPVVLGEYRDYLSCSRKVAVALLEHFDKSGFTRKAGDGRILRKAEG